MPRQALQKQWGRRLTLPGDWGKTPRPPPRWTRCDLRYSKMRIVVPARTARFFPCTERATPKSMDPGDVELVARIARGEQAALGILYGRYAGDVLRVAHALLRNEAQAADLVQDVFLEVWKRAGQYDDSRGTVRAWIVVRTRSRALDRLRSQTTRKEVSLSDPMAGSGASVEMEMSEVHLPRAFRAVSAEERTVLMLGYFEGLTCAEMSEKLSIPIGTVKSRTRTAMMKLRAFFEEGKQ